MLLHYLFVALYAFCRTRALICVTSFASFVDKVLAEALVGTSADTLSILKLPTCGSMHIWLTI